VIEKMVHAEPLLRGKQRLPYTDRTSAISQERTSTVQQEERVIGVTIASVRFYFRPNSVQREKSLSFKLWGFAEWFEYRLKPIREELRGPEVKGVNIVNGNTRAGADIHNSTARLSSH